LGVGLFLATYTHKKSGRLISPAKDTLVVKYKKHIILKLNILLTVLITIFKKLKKGFYNTKILFFATLFTPFSQLFFIKIKKCRIYFPAFYKISS